MSRRWWSALLLVMAFTLTACIGQISRADFQREVARRGGGMTSGLVDEAFAAFEKQFPGGKLTRLSISTGAVNAAIPVGGSGAIIDLDSFRFEYGAASWRDIGPVMVMAQMDIGAELFDPLQVTGLRNLNEMIATTRERSGLVDAVPSSVYVDNAKVPDRKIRVEMTAPRGEFTGYFTLEGVYIDGERG